MFGKNKKTSIAGLASILTAIADILTGLSTDPSMINWMVNFAAIISGCGLLFAKDGNVTGGSVVQATPVEASLEKMDEQASQGLVAPGVVAASKHVKADIAKADHDADKTAGKG